MKLAGWFLIGLFCAVGRSGAQNAPKFHVLVAVDGDEGVKDQVESTLSGALRSLGDVEVVFARENAGFGLSVVVAESRNKKGIRTGYDLAYLGTVNDDSAFIKELLDRHVAAKPECFLPPPIAPTQEAAEKRKAALLKLVTTFASGKESREMFGIVLGSPEDLKDLVNAIVTKFDTQVLKWRREKLEEIDHPKQ